MMMMMKNELTPTSSYIPILYNSQKLGGWTDRH